jgi:hypothetical protein
VVLRPSEQCYQPLRPMFCVWHSWWGRDQASLPKLLVRKCRFAYSSPNHLYRSRVVASWLQLKQPQDKDRTTASTSHTSVPSCPSDDVISLNPKMTRASNKVPDGQPYSPACYECRLLTPRLGPKLGRGYAIEPSVLPPSSW